MSRTQLILLHASVALTALTGIVFAWMKYAMTSDDPFAVVNHPMQPHMLSAHVVIAPVALFALGWIFGVHIWPRFVIGDPRRRVSGVTTMILIAPMVLSGYLLQIATNDAVRKAMATAHWIASGVFVVGYAAHLLGSRQRRETIDQPLQPS